MTSNFLINLFRKLKKIPGSGSYYSTKKETLKDNEIDSICEKIIKAIGKATSGKLRSL